MSHFDFVYDQYIKIMIQNEFGCNNQEAFEYVRGILDEGLYYYSPEASKLTKNEFAMDAIMKAIKDFKLKPLEKIKPNDDQSLVVKQVGYGK